MLSAWQPFFISLKINPKLRAQDRGVLDETIPTWTNDVLKVWLDISPLIELNSIIYFDNRLISSLRAIPSLFLVY